MSERLYKTPAGSYYTLWNDSSQDKPQKSEGLKTKDKQEARKRLSILNMLYESGYHKPFKKVWHKNNRIKHYVYSGDLNKIDIARGDIKSGVLLGEAVEEYITYKSEHRHWNHNSMDSIPPTLRKFANEVSVMVDDLSESDLHKYLYDKSDAYRETFMRRFNTFANWCVKENYMKEKPVYMVKKAQVSIPELITNDRLRKACHDCLHTGHSYKQPEKVWQALGWLFLRLTGLRPIELLSLKLEHVYEDRILVGASFTTKTRSQRFVDIKEPLRKVIEVLKSDAFRKTCTHSPDHILGRSGKSQKNWLAERFKHFTGAKLYSLKDTYGFWIITDKDQNREFNLIYLRDQFGHSSLETTEKYLKYAPKGDVIESLHDFEWLSNFLDECYVILNE